MNKEKQYSVAIRRRVNGDRFFDHDDFTFYEVKIDTKGRYWIADPFIFEKDQKTYLFYEAYDLVIQRGFIGYSVMKNDNSFSEPNIIISGGHKSFPYIFQKGENTYIIPESSEDREIKEYIATRFPDKWAVNRVLATEIFATDTIILDDKEQQYLLTSEQYLYPPAGKVISCWVKDRLIKIDENVLRNGKIVNEGDAGVRNAGAAFYYKGKLVRPGQNSIGGVYGRGLKFFEIDSISPYQEHFIYGINCEEMQKHVSFLSEEKEIIGTHTYNASENYEVIDISHIDVLRNNIYFMRQARTGAKAAYRELNSLKQRLTVISNKIKRKTCRNEEIYEVITNPNAPWVFVSYIADPFFHKDDLNYLNRHQNKRETLVMADVITQKGYNVVFMLHNSDRKIPDRNYKLLFGHEPNVLRAKEKYSDVPMIYYGVSMYFDYRNATILKMTKDFNEAFGANVPPRRMVKAHDAIEKSNSILLIGSDKTIGTFPENYRGKITKIHQSTQETRYLTRIAASGSNEFLYIASTGNVLKGIQGIIEFFSKHQEYVLHWVGPVETDVWDAIKKFITPNIISYGFQDIGSRLVLGLAERCDFLIYPSGVEGGPGSVLNCMKNGLIPLGAPFASFDGLDEYGYIMLDSSEESIDSAIKWAKSLSMDEIYEKKKSCQSFVLNNYNLVRFKSEYEAYIDKWL